MDTKLNLTIYDIVSQLIPGAVLLCTLQYLELVPQSILQGDTGIILLTYTGLSLITGAFLNVVAILLYSSFFEEDYEKSSVAYRLVHGTEKFLNKVPLLKQKSLKIKEHIKLALKARIKKEFGSDFGESRLENFVLADTLASTMGVSERDNLHAKEGFYRNLSALVVVLTSLFFITKEPKLPILAVGTLLTELTRFGREYYRTLKNQHIYTLCLLELKKRVAK